MKQHSGNNTELDKDLVRRVQQGDKSAFDLLVIKYQHRIIQLVKRKKPLLRPIVHWETLEAIVLSIRGSIG